jgi:23S rRNA (guanine745-N1)-methyltransferase
MNPRREPDADGGELRPGPSRPARPAGVTLVCPVRGCGAPLARLERALACPRGHHFDLARSGYCNLLQPQDRRSRQPGDSPAAVAARRRLFDRGHGDWLVPHLLAAFDALRLPAGAAVLDVGCGEGFYLGALAERREIEAHGLDLAATAVDLAARRYPRPTWVVANADRFLPYADGAFDLALSLTSRLNPAELRRVLAAPKRQSDPGGLPMGRGDPGDTLARHGDAGSIPGRHGESGGILLVGVPGADDLIELRAALLGEGRLRDRLGAATATLAADLERVGQATARDRVLLTATDMSDLLAATYRAGRHREARRADELARSHASGDAIEVTVSRDLAIFRPRPSST